MLIINSPFNSLSPPHLIRSNDFPLQLKILVINGVVLGITGLFFNMLVNEFTLVKTS